MTTVGLCLDGPKAGERMVFHGPGAPRSFEVIPRQRVIPMALQTGDHVEPVSPSVKTVTYRIFMYREEPTLVLYACGPTNPWETLTKVLAPLLELARAETERALDYYW